MVIFAQGAISTKLHIFFLYPKALLSLGKVDRESMETEPEIFLAASFTGKAEGKDNTHIRE